jgi:RNA-directed DNA polymerase
LILLLNPKVMGWAMYHRHICAKRTFQQVDAAIFQTLWQWAKRRHPEKGRRWIKEKYFTSLPGPCGGQQWVFNGEAEGGKDGPRRVRLFSASRMPIRRHLKVRADVNPYDPTCREYLAQRHHREP